VAYPKILPDELVARSVYPALRAMIADVLIKKYNYTQVEAAKKLGVTQAAISYYLSSKRGVFKQLFKSEFISKSVEEIAEWIEVLEQNLEHANLMKLQELAVIFIIEERNYL